jgi:MerR family transcriptional regulator, aldehyde-responsive regulator
VECIADSSGVVNNYPMEQSFQKLTIQDVSQRLNISKHTLRFWEKELDGIIVPLRTKGGQRRYTLEHLFIIEEIKRLKRKGMSLLGIKRKLNSIHGDESDETDPQEVDLLANQIAEIVKRAVYRYFEGEKSV